MFFRDCHISEIPYIRWEHRSAARRRLQSKVFEAKKKCQENHFKSLEGAKRKKQLRDIYFAATRKIL